MESLRSAAQRLRESLFLVPTAVMVVCIGLAGLARWLDRAVPGVEDLPVLLSVSLDGGRSIVTAVAGATITVAAIVFSITALSSQIASSQFSPRSVGGFFDNRFQQVVIGLVVGTFAYSLLVLGGLAGQDGTGAGQFRSVSVTLAVVLGIGSGIAIVAYIDHSLRRMRVNAVVRRIALATVAAVRRTHRSARAETDDGGMQHEGVAVPARAASLGWVRSIDGARLARILPPGAVARVDVRVGELVATGDRLATVWLDDDEDQAQAESAVRRAMYLGRDRSLARDPGFGIQQLVDIALRALSPGINDPHTAVDVVQHLKIPLRAVLTAEAPGRIHAGPRNQRVFLPDAASRSDHVHAAFAPIRRAAAGEPAVLRAILETASDLVAGLEETDQAGRASAVLAEAGLAAAAAQEAGFPAPDLQWVLSAARRLGLAEDDPIGEG